MLYSNNSLKSNLEKERKGRLLLNQIIRNNFELLPLLRLGNLLQNILLLLLLSFLSLLPLLDFIVRSKKSSVLNSSGTARSRYRNFKPHPQITSFKL